MASHNFLHFLRQTDLLILKQFTLCSCYIIFTLCLNSSISFVLYMPRYASVIPVSRFLCPFRILLSVPECPTSTLREEQRSHSSLLPLRIHFQPGQQCVLPPSMRKRDVSEGVIF